MCIQQCLTFKLDEPHVLLYAIHLVDPQGWQLMTGRSPPGTHTRILTTAEQAVVGSRVPKKKTARGNGLMYEDDKGLRYLDIFPLLSPA